MAAVGSAPIPAGQRSLPTPFLSKTYQLVEDPAVDDVISWGDGGSTFVVWRPAELARDLLPKYFKHSNLSSFVRQLNTYGFRKMVPDRWEFANDCFRRGEKRLLCDIHRRKAAVQASSEEQVLSSDSASASAEEQELPQAQAPSLSLSLSESSSAAGDEEKERLRRDNARLTRELGQMKRLCNNIVSLMSKFASTQQLDLDGSAVVNCCSGESAAPQLPTAMLDLMPSCSGLATAAVEADTSARLLGVSIGLKRPREDAEAEGGTC